MMVMREEMGRRPRRESMGAREWLRPASLPPSRGYFLSPLTGLREGECGSGGESLEGMRRGEGGEGVDAPFRSRLVRQAGCAMGALTRSGLAARTRGGVDLGEVDALVRSRLAMYAQRRNTLRIDETGSATRLRHREREDGGHGALTLPSPTHAEPRVGEVARADASRLSGWLRDEHAHTKGVGCLNESGSG